MKCPLLTPGSFAYNGAKKEALVDCLKEECAWWEAEANCCAALLIPRHLYTLERMLGLMLDKMPTKHQFRDR